MLPVIRALTREEVPGVWSIDRAEIIENIYYLEGGELVLKPEFYEVQDWPPGEAEKYTPILLDCFDRGGRFWGAFVGDELAGTVALDNRFMGRGGDRLQVKFMYVSREHRGSGLGRRLFETAVKAARELGARKLYVSSIPSENTVNFYLYLGFYVAEDVDAALFAMEPEDIHLECKI